MKPEIFEGARRISTALKWVCVVAYIVGAGAAFIVQTDLIYNLTFGTAMLLGCLFVLHFATKGIGWIVRGFAGIPQGQDSK